MHDLVPLRGTRFGVKGLAGYFVQFSLSTSGLAVSLEFEQPNGIFSAKRMS